MPSVRQLLRDGTFRLFPFFVGQRWLGLVGSSHLVGKKEGFPRAFLVCGLCLAGEANARMQPTTEPPSAATAMPLARTSSYGTHSALETIPFATLI